MEIKKNSSMSEKQVREAKEMEDQALAGHTSNVADAFRAITMAFE